MKIASGTTDQVIYFVCVDSADYVSRETGKTSGDFTVYRSRDGGAATAMTSPTVSELSSANCPGVYSLLLDEDMTIAAGNETEEMVFHITASGVAPITRTIELYRPKITEGYTLGVNSSGHVSRVTLADTTTTNTDMRGTDSAFLAASAPSNFSSLGINASGHIDRVTLCDTSTTNTDMRGTDNALLAASAPTNFSSLGINASGHISRVTLTDTTTTNTDMVTVSAISDGVWDESLSAHTVAGSTGKALKQIKEGIISIDGSVDDTSATSTTFITNLTASTDGYYHDKVIVFVSGGLNGQARHIETYVGSTKSVTVSQAFTAAPADGDEFLILATHEHSLNEISDAVWDELQSGHTVSGTFGYYLDSRVSQAGGGGGSTESVTVIQGYTPSRVSDSNATVFTGEEVPLEFLTLGVDGQSIDLSDRQMEAIFELEDGTDLLVIPNSSIIKTTTSVKFTVTQAVTLSSACSCLWALRDETTEEVYMQGSIYISSAARSDS